MSYFEDGLDGKPEPVLEENLREYRAGVRARKINNDLAERIERERWLHEGSCSMSPCWWAEQERKQEEADRKEVEDAAWEQKKAGIESQNDLARCGSTLVAPTVALLVANEYSNINPSRSSSDWISVFFWSGLAVWIIFYYLFRSKN